MLSAMRWLALLVFAVGCGGEDGGGGGATQSFGEHDLATLGETCEGISGMTGQALLDQKFEQLSAKLGYVTASGDKVSPTDVSISLVWPAAPIATCYPKHSDGTFTTEPRLGIAGLEMHFSTADGKFEEKVAATAWASSMQGALGPLSVVGVTTRSALKGSWAPFPDYGAEGSTLTFVNRLSGAMSAQSGGNVGMPVASLAELEAGVFKSGFAMAVWPLPP